MCSDWIQTGINWRPAVQWMFSDKTNKNTSFFWGGGTPASFLIILGLFKQTKQSVQQINVKNVKMSIQYTAPGFEHTTF